MLFPYFKTTPTAFLKLIKKVKNRELFKTNTELAPVHYYTVLFRHPDGYVMLGLNKKTFSVSVGITEDPSKYLKSLKGKVVASPKMSARVIKLNPDILRTQFRRFKVGEDVLYRSRNLDLFLNVWQALIGKSTVTLEDSMDAFVVRQNRAYHSGEKESLLTDAEFDNWREVYNNRLGRDWPLDKQVGAPVRSMEKVTLPFPMGSLEKVKDLDELGVWHKKTKANKYVVTPKLDGTSIQLKYDNQGRFINAWTRGDGLQGKDVTRALMLVPGVVKQISNGLRSIRGELAIPSRVFNKHFSKDFKNARNMMAGILNRSKPDEKALSRASFFAFHVYDVNMSKADQLKALKEAGFTPIPYKVGSNSIINDADAILEEFQQKVPVEMDGLVYEVNEASRVKTLGTETNSINPRYARAYKPAHLNTEGNLAETKVKEVEWNVSRHGFIIPTIIVEPVELAGATVERATAFNAAFVRDNKINKGAKVLLKRSGDVIPFIIKVSEPAKTISVPDRSKFGDYGWNETKVHYVVSGEDAGNSDAIRIERLVHFFEKCGVERFSRESISALYAAGFNTIERIVRIKPAELKRIDRMGDGTAANLKREFGKLLSVPMHVLMYASNCFGRNFGSRRLKAIVDVYGTKSLDWEGKTINEVAAQIAKIKGFSLDSGRAFAKGVMPFKKFLKANEGYIKGVYAGPKQLLSNKLKGAVVVFTGFRDNAAEALIEENGGTVASSVSSKTTHLLVPNKAFSSEKTKKAKAIGAKVMGLDEFKSAMKI